MKKYLLALCIIFISTVCCSQTSYSYIFTSSFDGLGDGVNRVCSQGYVVEKMAASNDRRPYLSIIYSKKSNQKEQKTYVFLYNDIDFYLSGDIPKGMKNKYTNNESTTNKILNLLSQNGFQLDQLCMGGSKYFILFSKNKSGSTRVDSAFNSEEEVKEMARYNLKGMPIDSNYKGIQIIVYSDYTTKVVNKK